MGVLDIFRPLKKSTISKYKELGAYQSTFSVFGNDIYRSEIVRSCIRPLADFSSKAEAKCGDKRIERMLNHRPNQYMSGHDFIYKVRTKVELLNTAFIYIQRNDRMQVVGLYPVPYSYFEAVEYLNGLFIRFYFSGDATSSMVLPWDDLAVIRKDYNNSDIAGDDNLAIVNTLEMLNTVNQGLANSIKATANLRGILKSTKAMLAPDAIKKMKEEFVKDYMNLSNDGGIAALDSMTDFTPISMSPMTASYEQMKEYREDIYRYFGVNEEIVTSSIKTENLENFYRLKIEPFLVALSQELTSKVFAGKASAYEVNQITYMADQGQFMTMTQKLELFNKVVLYGGMTVNEWRHLLGYTDIEGGDTPVRRLDADFINMNEKPRPDNDNQEGEDEDGKAK